MRVLVFKHGPNERPGLVPVPNAQNAQVQGGKLPKVVRLAHTSREAIKQSHVRKITTTVCSAETTLFVFSEPLKMSTFMKPKTILALFQPLLLGMGTQGQK